MTRVAPFALAIALLAPPSLAMAQGTGRTEEPTGPRVCAECETPRQANETQCSLCGVSATKTGRTPDPTPPRNAGTKDYPRPTSPAPKLDAPPPTAPKPPSPPPEPKVDPKDEPPPRIHGAEIEKSEEGLDPRSRAYRDDNMAKGDYYFKTGYYLKASESYRVAVLAEPVNPWKKLAFGHALFAIGNYSYSSYALRRAVSQLDGKESFSPEVASLFPSKKAFEKAVRDLKRYVTYSPRDPAGLSVLGYMLYAQGEDDRAKEMFAYLQKLPKNESDPFAAFFMKQIEARAKGGKTPEPVVEKPLAPPPPPKPEPKPVVVTSPPVTTPEGTRQDEEPAPVKPLGGAAIAE